MKQNHRPLPISDNQPWFAGLTNVHCILPHYCFITPQPLLGGGTMHWWPLSVPLSAHASP